MIRGNRPHLTQNERAVLLCMAAGQKPKQIAAALNISRHTYQRWVTIIRNKLGAITDTQVGVLIERYQLVSVARANVIEDCREERLDARRAGAA